MKPAPARCRIEDHKYTSRQQQVATFLSLGLARILADLDTEQEDPSVGHVGRSSASVCLVICRVYRVCRPAMERHFGSSRGW